MDSLHCIVVDDEYGAIQVLEHYIRKLPWLVLDATFSDSVEALNHLEQHPTDVVFLDINMPDLGGLQLARLIKARNTAIIFCTAYPEHALESYEVKAVDYLLKPIPFDRFLSAVNKLKDSLSYGTKEAAALPPRQEQLFIKSGTQIHQIDVSDIRIIRKDGHYIVFKIKGKELLTRMTFSQLTELLPPDRFVQIHRSYIVALDKIELIQKQFIQIEGKEFPIGDAYKDAFFKRVNTIGS